MKNKNEGIFNSIKPKTTVYGYNEMKTKSEMIEALNKLSEKQFESKPEVNLEDFRGVPLSKVITVRKW